jgi:hypothetical protein
MTSRLSASLVWVAVVVCLTAATAVADERTVVLVSSDAQVQAAMAAAAASSGWTIVRGRAEAGQGTTASAARDLVEAQDAGAAVWLVSGDRQTTTLYVYDRKADRLLVRALPYGAPYSEAQAAEVARTSRGMLRSLRGEPDVPDPPPVIAVELGPPPPPEPRLGVEVAVGLRASGELGAVPELRLGVSWRLRWLEVAVVLDAAPDAEIPGGRFKGEVSDSGLAIVARYPVPLGEQLAIRPGVGLVGHLVAVKGVQSGGGGGAIIDDSRLLPGVRAQVQVDWRLARRVAVGAVVAVDLGLTSPTYEADGMLAYSPDRARFFVGVGISLGLL